MEEKVHAVYVSNLPTDITMDEFKVRSYRVVFALVL